MLAYNLLVSFTFNIVQLVTIPTKGGVVKEVGKQRDDSEVVGTPPAAGMRKMAARDAGSDNGIVV
jgi:hypothetical protein